jgi:hypothetical protein
MRNRTVFVFGLMCLAAVFSVLARLASSESGADYETEDKLSTRQLIDAVIEERAANKLLQGQLLQ